VFKLATSEMRIVSGTDGIPTLIRLPGQATSVVRAGVGAKAGAPRVNYDAPAGAPYTAEQVKIPSGRGYDLAATLTRPVGPAKVPVVITISGSGPQERDSRIYLVDGYAIFRQVADTLGRRGIAVLRYDDRGCGRIGRRESAMKATSADLADDARSIITWLRARPDIDGTRIALAGHSEGGMIAPMIAASDPKVKGIALLAGPAYTGSRVSLYQNRQLVDGAPTLTPQQRDSIMATVPAKLDSAGKATPWLGFWLKHDPVVVAKAVKQPVLILQDSRTPRYRRRRQTHSPSHFAGGGNKDVTLRSFRDEPPVRAG
jgi:dienelactone hydrolase